MLFIFLYLIFKSSCCLLNFFLTSWWVLPFFFEILDYLLSLFWTLLKVACLSPLLLVFLFFSFVDFYLVHLSKTYFCIISFCLSFYFCDLLSAGCTILVLFVSGVCSLLGDVGLEICAHFLVGVTGVFPLVAVAGSCLSGGQGHVKGCVYRWLSAQYDFRQHIRD